MALTRLVSALAGLVIFSVILFLPPIVFGVAIFLITVIAIIEYNTSMGKSGGNPFYILSLVPVLIILFIVFAFETKIDLLLFAKRTIGSLILFFITFLSLYILNHKKHTIKDVFVSIFSTIYLVPLFSALVAIRYLDFGIYHIFFAFGGAWITDTFAYFSGRLFGKKKLIPIISPKKTIAGAVGGIIGTTISAVVYGLILNNNVYNDKIPVIIFVLLGILLSVFSQFGDLFASSIKRYADIKDFGKLMPGHGGVIDRFDSVLFTSAIAFIYVLIFF